MLRNRLFLTILAIVLGLGWYWFRPELLFIDREVNETLPTVETSALANGPGQAEDSIVLATGDFRSVAHQTTGKAAIHRLADGTRVVRLTDFATSNGPDVRVLIVAAADASDNVAVENAGYVELGVLKGNKGDQNYLLPQSVDLNRYRAITIWCHRFSVNFGTASLKPQESPTT